MLIPLEYFTDGDEDEDHDHGYLVMKVLVMKVMIVKEVITGDVSPVALFFPLGSLFHKKWVSIGFLSYANRCRKKFNAVL